MGSVFKVLGIIGFVIVGFLGISALAGSVATAGLAGVFGVLFACLLECIIPAILFALGTVMEDNAQLRRDMESKQTPVNEEMHKRNVLSSGGWKCSCGRVNAAYVSSCVCGKGKHEKVE
jgi:hypothetical protein